MRSPVTTSGYVWLQGGVKATHLCCGMQLAPLLVLVTTVLLLATGFSRFTRSAPNPYAARHGKAGQVQTPEEQWVAIVNESSVLPEGPPSDMPECTQGSLRLLEGITFCVLEVACGVDQGCNAYRSTS